MMVRGPGGPAHLLARAAGHFAAKALALRAADEGNAGLTAAAGRIPGELPVLIGTLAMRAAVFGAHGTKVAS